MDLFVKSINLDTKQLMIDNKLIIIFLYDIFYVFK
jgi:hypothetical protein